MSITIHCKCGKTFKVRDEFAGRRGKCLGCGQLVAIPAGQPLADLSSMHAVAAEAELPSLPAYVSPSPSSPAPGGPAPTIFPGSRPRPVQKQNAPPLASLFTGFFTPGRIALLLLVIFVVGGGLFLKLGPLKARDEWNKVQEHAEGDVKDVVTRAIQISLMQHLAYDPRRPGHIRGAKEVNFVDMNMMMRMPDAVGFAGTSTEGKFVGVYHTRTGEVEARVPMDGATINVTGRVRGNDIQCEINGKTAVAPPLPPLRDDE